jgi:V/A-type H+-transporting ATPase subunit I
MIEPMAKVRLIVPRHLVEGVAATLQEIGLLHIESAPSEAIRIPLRPHVMDEAARQRRAVLDRLREELHRLLLMLPEISSGEESEAGPSRPELTEEGLTSLIQMVREIGSRVDETSARLKACEEELALLSKYEKALVALTPFLGVIQESEELDHLGVVLEEKEKDHRLLEVLHEILTKMTHNRYELFHARLDEQSMVVIMVFPKAVGPKIRGLLWEEGITELQLPVSVGDKPLGHALRIVLQKKAELPIQASRHRQDLNDLALRWRGVLVRSSEAVLCCLEQVEATASFYQTKMTSIIYGWVPRRSLAGMSGRIGAEFGGKAVIEECPIDSKERRMIPVILRNPGVLRPFETLTRLIALPVYGSIDPTPYLAVFFPLFYGMILGDVGYGLLLLAGAAIVRRRYTDAPLVRDLADVFLVASATAVLFGVLFGELFGALGEYVGLRPIFNRMEAFMPFLAVSIAIGTLHVVLGIALGAWSAWRRGDRQEGVAKVGGLLLVVAFVSLIASVANLLPRTWMTAATAVLVSSLAIIFTCGGVRGAMELHNLVNVLSYLRLMGIGVASAALAFAANALGGMVGNVFLTVAVGGTLHAINFVFGILSPTIQSLRLHYVEFFENFFVAGGRPYRPFRRSEA